MKQNNLITKKEEAGQQKNMKKGDQKARRKRCQLKKSLIKGNGEAQARKEKAKISYYYLCKIQSKEHDTQ